MKKTKDWGFWLTILSAALTLSSVSLLCPTAQAGSGVAVVVASAATPPPSPTVADAPANEPAPVSLDVDDGGNELLEHWMDPKFTTEAHRQISGLLVLLSLAGAAGAWRRRALRRRYAHD